MKMNAFSYYGGKYSHLSWLLPLLPDARTYVEPFGGSMAVLLNRKPSPVEVYNDLNFNVVNFFRVLREKPDELLAKLRLTPVSRYEFAEGIKALKLLPEGRTETEDERVERARQFFVVVAQSYLNIPNPTPGQWTSRPQGRTSEWRRNIERLKLVANRIIDVVIEHDDAYVVIERYDSPDTLFYIDPPYLLDTRPGGEAYAKEIDEYYHRKLAKLLHKVKGKVALSHHESELYNELYCDFHVFKTNPIRGGSVARSERERVEFLWTNYEVPQEIVSKIERLELSRHIVSQGTLFDISNFTMQSETETETETERYIATDDDIPF